MSGTGSYLKLAHMCTWYMYVSEHLKSMVQNEEDKTICHAEHSLLTCICLHNKSNPYGI